MKTFPLTVTAAIAAATLLGGAGALHAQDNGSFVAPRQNNRTRAGNAATRLAPRTDGAVVRAVRSGHPLQMINPGAPAEYGNGNDTVRHEANDPYQRPQGIKLFVVEF